jgi:hypothetical protein
MFADGGHGGFPFDPFNMVRFLPDN